MVVSHNRHKRDDQFAGMARYVRISSNMQEGSYSIAEQKQAIREACALLGLPTPVFFEDASSEEKETADGSVA